MLADPLRKRTASLSGGTEMSRLLSQERVYAVTESPSGGDHTRRDHSESTNANLDAHDPEQAHPIAIDHELIDAVSNPPQVVLSPKQREVLGLACRDIPYSEIAVRLSISEDTVSTHMVRVYEKLGLHGRNDRNPMNARDKAIEHGLIDPVSGNILPQKQELLRPRQREVLRLLCQGRTVKDIATRLSLDERTVRNHLEIIDEKLGVDREHVPSRAVKLGLVDKNTISQKQQKILSPTQHEVLCFSSQGKADKDIALALSMAESTVYNHWHTIRRKLGGHDRAEALTIAMDIGLIDEDPILRERHGLLSPRQHEALQLLCQGMADQEDIAERLCVPERIAEALSHRIYEILAVETREQAYSKAAQLGLIDVDLTPEEREGLLTLSHHYLIYSKYLEDKPLIDEIEVHMPSICKKLNVFHFTQAYLKAKESSGIENELLTPEERGGLLVLYQRYSMYNKHTADKPLIDKIEAHLPAIYEKLGVDTHKQAYYKILELKLFRPDELLSEMESRFLLFLCQGYDGGTIRSKVEENRYGRSYSLDDDLDTDTYLHRIYEKLGVETREESHYETLELGLFTLKDLLTRREVEVFGHVCEGLSNRDIGALLFIGEGTIKNHVEHILGKLMVGDRVQACVKAIRLGLIDAASLNPIPWEPFEPLTPREDDVLYSLCDGQPNSEIAKNLEPPIGQGTVKTHVDHIRDKLGANDRMQVIVAALAAAKRGLLNLKPCNPVPLAALAPQLYPSI